MKNEVGKLVVGDVAMVSYSGRRPGVRWQAAKIKRVGREYLYASLHGWDEQKFSRADGRERSNYADSSELRTLAYHKYVVEEREPVIAVLKERVNRYPFGGWVDRLTVEQASAVLRILVDGET